MAWKVGSTSSVSLVQYSAAWLLPLLPILHGLQFECVHVMPMHQLRNDLCHTRMSMDPIMEARVHLFLQSVNLGAWLCKTLHASVPSLAWVAALIEGDLS